MSLPAFAAGGDDTFSSTSEMAALASKEAKLVTSLREYRDRLEECEGSIRQKSEDIFGNLEEIYDFHSQVTE